MLIRWNTFFVLDFCLDILDGVRWLNLQWNSRLSKSFYFSINYVLRGWLFYPWESKKQNLERKTKVKKSIPLLNEVCLKPWRKSAWRAVRKYLKINFIKNWTNLGWFDSIQRFFSLIRENKYIYWFLIRAVSVTITDSFGRMTTSSSLSSRSASNKFSF